MTIRFHHAAAALLSLLLAACPGEHEDPAADSALPDMARLDLPQSTPDLARADLKRPDMGDGRTCAGAIPMPKVGDRWTFKGKIVAAAADNDLFMPVASCVKAATPGPDRFHSVELKAGQRYAVTVDAAAGAPLYLPVLYVLSDCNSPNTSCLAAAAATSSSQALLLQPTKSGRHVVVVDSTFSVGIAGAYGGYTVNVRPLTGSNGTCTGAEVLNWSGPAVATAGDTGAAASHVNAACVCPTCTTPGKDLFYKVRLTAKQKYTITVTPSQSAAWDPLLYLFDACPLSTCQGVDKSFAGGSETLTYTPGQSGDFYIGVDSKYGPGETNSAGLFSLTVKQGP